MARMRSIKIGFFENELLAECDPLARLLFAGLWCLADKDGCVEYRPKRIKKQLLPWDECDIHQLHQQLSARGFISFFQSADGREALRIVKFSEHQRPHKDERSYGLTEMHGSFPAVGGNSPLYMGSGELDVGSGLRGMEGSSEPPSAASEPPVLVFDCVGKGPRTWALTQSKIAEWQASYPSLDVPAEARKAWQWIVDRPTRRKTAGGMIRYLGGWMQRANDSRRGPANQSAQRLTAAQIAGVEPV